MKEADMFKLIWDKFVDTGLIRENGYRTHKLLYQRTDGYWVLQDNNGNLYLARPTIEELMVEAISQGEFNP
jgi:hypothetical protein